MIRSIGIVSLSAGTIGEAFVRHEVELGLRRLRDYGLTVHLLPNAMKGRSYLMEHPEARASDLLEAFRRDDIDMILCAIGGDDTYRLAPYLFEHDELRSVLRDKPFLGFSDSTVNHLMLHRLGLPTFYGQSFLADVCEMGETMLPYTAHYLEELLTTGRISEVRPSPVWYEGRTDYSPEALGTELIAHPNGGWRLLQGAPRFTGKLLGGCVETLFDLLDGGRYADSPAVAERYGLFPTIEDWRGRILLLETSEEQHVPEEYAAMLQALKRTGVFSVVSGILCGKPMDERYMAEYERILVDTVDDPSLPILADLSIGHAQPRCILPFGIDAEVDAEAQCIRFRY